jgi:predicted transcriptional regulator
MKAIIEIVHAGDYAKSALDLARQVDAGVEAPETDYRLGFHSSEQMFRALTPERLRALETLQRSGAMSIYALAKALRRNYSNVHRDVKALMEHDLIVKTEDDKVFVPFDEIELRLTFGPARSAA